MNSNYNFILTFTCYNDNLITQFKIVGHKGHVTNLNRKQILKNPFYYSIKHFL